MTKKATTLLGLLLLFTACRAGTIEPRPSSSTTSTSTNPATVTPAVISTSSQGAEAASAVLQSKELVVTSSTIFRDLGFITQAQMISAVSSTGTGTCTDYGTYSYTSTYNGSGSYNVSYTFDLCRQNNFQYDGTYSANGSASKLNGDLTGLKILNFQNAYKTLIGSLVGSGVYFSMQGSGTVSDATYTITANGSMQAFDYYSIGQHTLYFNKLATRYAVTTDSGTNTQTSLFTTNGMYSVAWSSKVAAVTYSNFTVGIQKQVSTNTMDASIAGRIVVNYTPNGPLEGAFDVTTTTPIQTITAPFPPRTTQGSFTINNTAVTAYASDGTVSVSVAGDTALNFEKEFTLMKEADFYAMKQQLPIVSGLTGTATGSNMSISALSTGSTTTDLNCYTDVHVNYYTNTNPTVSDTILWFVDWHKGLSTCTPQAAIPYQEATSSTGIAGDPCDMGLDINGANFDITSGGVEHFLAANLPVGYYILSINNYSCSPVVHNDATLLVGDYLFGTYTCVYSTSDVEGYAGFNPGAWCRLVDVRVNTGGLVEVLNPDPLLVPWH